MTDDEFLQLVRETASDAVVEFAKVQREIQSSVSPVALSSFPLNVAQTILAMTIEFFVQYSKGVDLPDDQTSDNIYELKKKIGDAMKPIIAERSGMVLLHKRIEGGGESK